MKKYKRYQQKLESSSIFIEATPWIEKVDNRKKRKTEALLNCCSVLVENIAKEFPESLNELHQILVEFKESKKNK